MSQAVKSQKLWIVIKDTLSAYPTLKEAVDQFEDLAIFVTSKAKLIELSYNPQSKEQWTLSSLTIEEIAQAMMAKKK